MCETKTRVAVSNINSKDIDTRWTNTCSMWDLNFDSQHPEPVLRLELETGQRHMFLTRDYASARRMAMLVSFAHIHFIHPHNAAKLRMAYQ